MPKQPSLRARITAPAAADLDYILETSEAVFGYGASVRYAGLIRQALRDLEADPGRLGVRKAPERHSGIFTYHLGDSRTHVKGPRVRSPRHVIVFRLISDALVILRLLHDREELSRNLPDDD